MSLVVRHWSLIRQAVIPHSVFVLSLFTPALQGAENIGGLGSKPKWSVLEHYQETITRDEFTHLIHDIYCTHGFAPDLMEVAPGAASQ